MDALIKRRRTLKSKITRIVNVTAQHNVNPISLTQVNNLLEQIIILREQLNQLQELIGETCDDADYDTHEADFNQLADRIDAVAVSLQDMIPTPGPSTLSSSSTGTKTNIQVKLPRLDLPKFNGNLSDWTSFSDLFKAAVHKNESISGAQKLQYLKSCLQGEALSLLNSIEVTDTNYDEAWEILINRFQRKRQLVHSHLKRMFSQPSIITESTVTLRKLIDTTTECVRALKGLGLPTNEWDAILIHLVTEKLDHESRKQWELSLDSNDIPEFKELTDFIYQRADALAAAGKAKEVKIVRLTDDKPTKTDEPPKFQRRSFHTATDDKKKTCIICSGEHPIWYCKKLLDMKPNGRAPLIRQKGLCGNCLSGRHQTTECTSTLSCRHCNQRHHSLLHVPHPTTSAATPRVSETPDAPINSTHGNLNSHHVQVLLSTAIIKVEDCVGQPQLVRALLDNGSQASFMSEACVQQLGLKRHRSNIPINGLAMTGAGTTKGRVSCKFWSTLPNSQFSGNLEALILPKITGLLPNYTIKTSYFHPLKNHLADPQFHEPGKIDILIGSDILFYLMLDGRIKGPEGTPNSQNSVFGWIISGKIDVPSIQTQNSLITHHSLVDLDTQLKKFWEIEEISSTQAMSIEEKKCEAHFNQTTKQEANGQYTVQFPFKENSPNFGDSRSTAIHRLKQMERRLQQDPDRRETYQSFMKEYFDLGHMTQISPDQVQGVPSYYLPHHAVIKPTSTTTKLRVVFDGSCKSSNGQSLNTQLMVGPKLQQDLHQILLRFRTHKIAISADIAKMYRQIWINPIDRDFQRVLWRENPEDPIQDFRLSTVTYGTASAPFQAVKCLQQLALDQTQEFPEISKIVLRDFYVDDLISGNSDLDQARSTYLGIFELLKKAGFPIRKWSSNSEEFLESIPMEYRETKSTSKIWTTDQEHTVSTLGIRWNPELDLFSFFVKLPEYDGISTKRTLLSDVARIFDPLGWLAPVVISAKILFQKLWTLGLTWDEPLPLHITEEWLQLRQDLSCIEDISLPRWLQSTGPSDHYQIHGFSDASEVAYSAVIYLRVQNEDGVILCNLVTAKTKVAPIKQISLPRLELCGAVLLSRLIHNVHKTLCLPIEQVFAWTDSTVTLAWLTGHPNRWKTFVANRVSEVQDLVPPHCWNHVRSEENPADCASRGIQPSELKTHDLWWHGPQWLLHDSEYWPSSTPVEPDPHLCLELKKLKPLTALATNSDAIPFSDFSSLNKLKRVTAYCLRFAFNSRNKHATRKYGPISATELHDSFHVLIRKMQLSEFPLEIKACQQDKLLPPKSSLLGLHPFLDKSGILRVGGRLGKTDLPEDRKHPIILPRRHQLTELIISHEHLRNCHAGPQLLLHTLQQTFWIICGRDVVCRHVNRCISCFRQRAATSQQLMGELPLARVEPTRAFLRTGVDYAGPITLRLAPGRCKQFRKGYISLFVCMVTKAIHLELVSDLTTEAFLAALKRFISRRGRSLEIFSDCGTNFVGANRELKELIALLISQEHNSFITHQLASEGITWKFNPPGAPHQGGLWEAGVRSMKHHIRRVIGNNTYTFEEYSTLLCQVEACLNSRPLCRMSEHPENLFALTPGHFLIGEPLNSIPEPDLTHLPVNRLNRWEKIQQATRHFWKRWSLEYLNQLQQRPKWMNIQPDLKVGDIVIVKEDNLPPLKWNLARITKTHPGEDGRVRVVTLECSSGTIKRPIVKVCPLPIETC